MDETITPPVAPSENTEAGTAVETPEAEAPVEAPEAPVEAVEAPTEAPVDEVESRGFTLQ